MKFPKVLYSRIPSTMPGWEGKFMSYKDLRKQLNVTKRTGRDEDFRQLFENELEKMNDFFLAKEEEYTIRFQELKDVVAGLYSSEDTQEVTRDLLQFHNELVMLVQYNVHNRDGILKIIKKHKRKTGSSISLPYMQGDEQPPFFVADFLSRLLAECEAIIRQLEPTQQ